MRSPADPAPAPDERSGHALDADAAIVITCFNQGRFLGEAIASALAQTHPPAQVIVVDDGSTDETAAIAAQWPQAEYVWRPNGGPAAARNSGLERTTSSFVSFLDADDRLLPGSLQSGLRVFWENPHLALVYGGFWEIAETGERLWFSPPQRDRTGYAGLLRGNHIAMQGAVVYRTSLLKAVGGFDERLRACEDYELYLRLARDHAIAAHPDAAAEYRRHGSNTTRDAGLMLGCALEVMRRQRCHVARNAELRTALAEGCTFWRDYYGERLVTQVRRELGAGAIRAGLKSLATAARCDPGLARRLLHRLAKRTGADESIASGAREAAP
jgi:glycosyltransferase involved in cell wall biosynthesis